MELRRIRTSSPFSFFVMLGAVVALGLFAFGIRASSPGEAAAAAAYSPAADVDLICPNDNLAECYPRVFQATDEFQRVREDQELPSGLHVRLNVWTGEKEAKLNNPDEDDPALEGLPVDRAIVVLTPEQAEEIKLPHGAPAYDPAGKIKKPDDESHAFYDSLAMLREGIDLDAALEGLEELSHDIYYGLKIAEDVGSVKSLFCLMSNDHVWDAEGNAAVVQRARQAAVIIAAAVQNNPKALNEIEKNWQVIMGVPECPGHTNGSGFRDNFFKLISGPSSTTPTHNEPSLVKARVSAINGLLKSPRIRDLFLTSGGISHLLAVLRESGEIWQSAQRRVGELLQDTFLDESMGATLGLWPLATGASAKFCEQNVELTQGECAEYYVRELVKTRKAKKDHWSVELLDKMRKQRETNQRREPLRDEL